MRDTEMMTELATAGKLFRAYFREVLDIQIARTTEACGFTDEHFVAAMAAMFDNPNTLRNISVEHRQALVGIYEDCREAWLSVGATIST